MNLVTIEQAKQLKINGFKKPCEYFYQDRELTFCPIGIKRTKNGIKMNHNKYDDFIYSMPTVDEYNDFYLETSKVKFQIIKKAYEINLHKIEDGFLSDNIFCYSDSRNEAKYKLLKTVQYDDLKLNHYRHKVTYTNIPVIRLPERDIVLFENKEVTKSSIIDLICERIRLDKLNEILNDDSISDCYLYKGGYYYRPNAKGYTSNTNEAGIYSKEDAVSHAKSCRELSIIPIKNW